MLIRFIAPALVVLPLLSGVPTEAAPTVPLIDQIEDPAITDQAAIQPVYWVRDGWGHWWHHDRYWWPRDHYWWHHDHYRWHRY
jgi:hypothetical protein